MTPTPRCRRCARTLTAKTSTSNGIGPECRNKAPTPRLEADAKLETASLKLPEGAYARAILARMDEGRRLTSRMKRYVATITPYVSSSEAAQAERHLDELAEGVALEE